MAPTASQVHDLCSELRFIAKVGDEEKLHVGSKQIQPANDLLTRFLRLVTWETKEATIKFVQEKTGRALEFCEQLYLNASDRDSRDLLQMLISDLNECIQSDHGLEALVKTYQSKHKAAADLEVVIRNIRMKVVKYQAVFDCNKSESSAPK